MHPTDGPALTDGFKYLKYTTEDPEDLGRQMLDGVETFWKGLDYRQRTLGRY